MITTDFTGNFGNHIWQYVVLRSIAHKKNLEWGFTKYIYGDYYGGKSQMDFLDLDYGKQVTKIDKEYKEKIVVVDGNVNIHLYDTFDNLQDGSKLVGCWQTEKYFKDIKDQVKQWVKVKSNVCKPILDDNVCIINIRGGEYRNHLELLFPQTYWNNAMKHMLHINPSVTFLVITDDIQYAKQFFPNIPCHHFDIATDYCFINQAKYLILSNSSFAYFPAWLNDKCKYVIAPKYWARHNTSDGYWANSCIYTEGWNYLNRDGKIESYSQVLNELMNSKYKQYYI